MGACEQEHRSVPSSMKEPQEKHEDCAVGELIKLDNEGTGVTKAVDVFLAEEKERQAREELGGWRWEDIKGENEERGGGKN